MNENITGERIEDERELLNMTKRKISDVLEISTRSYWNYISGGTIPSYVLIRMARLFGCSTDYLLGLTNERTTA